MSKKPTFQRIAIIGRSGQRHIPETLTALKNYLVSIDRHVVTEPNTAKMIGDCNLATVNADDLHKHAELIIVVGGDGSLLNAAHMALNNTLPILGINRGRLGFLTDIFPNELESILPILNGQYISEERFVLQANIISNNKSVARLEAINDLVLLHANATHMIEFGISVNNQFVCSQLADGLIIATPTGSTAYALSGGGPIMHPNLETLALVPMLPHTLSNRPIVVSACQPVSVELAADTHAAFISADGMTRVDLPPESRIMISKMDQSLTLVHAQDYNYYTSLREKLGWQSYAQRG
jgi:NAD+ kinase